MSTPELWSYWTFEEASHCQVWQVVPGVDRECVNSKLMDHDIVIQVVHAISTTPSAFTGKAVETGERYWYWGDSMRVHDHMEWRLIEEEDIPMWLLSRVGE